MRIAVTGRNGQVVSALMERGAARGQAILPLGRPELDLTDPGSILPALSSARPDVIVSAAGYTAVDQAESEPDVAQAVNGMGAGLVAGAAARLEVPVIHLSTDYVFDGAKSSAYVETDAPAPLGVYAASKLEGERRVTAATHNHVILRVGWVYSPFGANFVRRLLRLAETRDELGVVADQIGGPTSAHDIADAILAVSARLLADPSVNLRGIFHLSPRGSATWADFAETILDMAHERGHRACRIKRIATADYPTTARRPANSRLDGGKIQANFGIALPEWKMSLDGCLDRLLDPGR